MECCIAKPCAFCAIDMNIFVSDSQGLECRFCNYKNIATELLSDCCNVRWCVSCKDNTYNYLFRCGFNSTRGIPHKENGYIVKWGLNNNSTCVTIQHTLSTSLLYYHDTDLSNLIPDKFDKKQRIRINHAYHDHLMSFVAVKDFCIWNNLDYQETCTNMQNYFHVSGSRTKAALKEPIKSIESLESIKSIEPFEPMLQKNDEEKTDLFYHVAESTEFVQHNNIYSESKLCKEKSDDKPIITKQIPYLNLSIDLCDFE
jgi:hypothetical protein